MTCFSCKESKGSLASLKPRNSSAQAGGHVFRPSFLGFFFFFFFFAESPDSVREASRGADEMGPFMCGIFQLHQKRNHKVPTETKRQCATRLATQQGPTSSFWYTALKRKKGDGKKALTSKSKDSLDPRGKIPPSANPSGIPRRPRRMTTKKPPALLTGGALSST